MKRCNDCIHGYFDKPDDWHGFCVFPVEKLPLPYVPKPYTNTASIKTDSAEQCGAFDPEIESSGNVFKDLGLPNAEYLLVLADKEVYKTKYENIEKVMNDVYDIALIALPPPENKYFEAWSMVLEKIDTVMTSD